jgi:hypothetical protein
MKITFRVNGNQPLTTILSNEELTGKGKAVYLTIQYHQHRSVYDDLLYVGMILCAMPQGHSQQPVSSVKEGA